MTKKINKSTGDTFTRDGKPLELVFTKMQEKVFNDPHQFVIFCKGRRCGGTNGAALIAIRNLLQGKNVLWVDTIQLNLSGYYKKFFIPILNKINPLYWKWMESRKELTIKVNGIESKLCMRSAQKPEGLEGFAYDIIILNETGIILQKDYLWYNAISPMVMDYRAKCFFIGTPKGKFSRFTGKEHIYYTFYKRGLDESPEWKDWVSYTASSYDNELLPKEEIDRYVADTPPFIRDQEVYAKFMDLTNECIFKPEWFRDIKKDSINEKFEQVIMSLDTAYKTGDENDFSVAQVWGKIKSNFYLLDCLIDKLTFPDLVVQIKKLYDQYMPDQVLIEDKASGQSLIQELQVKTTMPIVAIKVDKDKVTRAAAISPYVEQGKVFFVYHNNGYKPDWANTVKDQAALFPFGEYDDCVDAMSQALNWWRATGSWDNLPAEPVKSISIGLKSATLRGYMDYTEIPQINNSMKSNLLEGFWN